MKKRLVVAFAATIVIVLIAAVGINRARRIRVGALLPLSGPDAAVGLGMRNSIRLAVEQVNRRGGVQGRKVQLVEVDEASNPEKAAAGASALRDDKRVVGVIGTYDHDSYVAAQPILGDAKVPFLSAGISNRDRTAVGLGGYDAEFALLPFGSAQMAHAAKYAWDVLGARTFVYVRDESHFAGTTVSQMRAALTPFFKKVVTGEEVAGSEAELPALVAKIKAAPPDYVFFAGRPDLAAHLLVQLRDAGVTSHFQDASHFPSQEFIDVAKEKAEGALAVFHGIPPEDFPEGREFLKAYAAEGFREPPSIYGIYAYAETQALLEAANRSFLTRPSVAGALRNEELPTALGPIRFIIWIGSTYQAAALYQVVKGKWTPIQATDKGQLKPFTAR